MIIMETFETQVNQQTEELTVLKTKVDRKRDKSTRTKQELKSAH